jgi:exosortase A
MTCCARRPRKPHEGRPDGPVPPNRMQPIVSAPVIAEAPIVLFSDWRRVLPPLAVGLLLLGLVFSSEVVAAVDTWNSSTAYNHCFLVIPIALYLLWDRRDDLFGIPARLMPAALALGLPLAAVWLLSERLGIMEGRQLVAVGFAQLLFLAVLGDRLWRAMAGPLLYLFFLVPFGEFLTPKLQDVTTFFVSHGLDILGVPAYIDGYIIEIPQGTFFVAEACAGLRFLIASIAFGCLYALLMYRSPVRRGVFILISVIVPIVANGFRGLGIVYLGYVLGNAQAAVADHIIYGWIFFSVVILVLIALGLPFRQDGLSTRSALPSAEADAPVASTLMVVAVVAGIVVIAAISPGVATGLTVAAATPFSMPSRIDVGADCAVQPVPPVEGVVIRGQRVSCGGVTMDMNWEAFSPRSTAAPVMAVRRRMVAGALTESLQEDSLAAGDGTSTAWRILKSNEPAYVIAVSVWIDGKPVRPGLTMRLRMALSSLMGSRFMPTVLTVTPAVDWGARTGPELNAAADALPGFLLAHRDLDGTVGALSALR